MVENMNEEWNKQENQEGAEEAALTEEAGFSQGPEEKAAEGVEPDPPQVEEAPLPEEAPQEAAPAEPAAEAAKEEAPAGGAPSGAPGFAPPYGAPGYGYPQPYPDPRFAAQGYGAGQPSAPGQGFPAYPGYPPQPYPAYPVQGPVQAQGYPQPGVPRHRPSSLRPRPTPPDRAGLIPPIRPITAGGSRSRKRRSPWGSRSLWSWPYCWRWGSFPGRSSIL